MDRLLLVLVLKALVYPSAFCVLGRQVLHTRLLPAIGLSLAGGLARGVGGIVGGVLLAVLVSNKPWPIIFLSFAFVRFSLWFVLARFLFKPPTNVAIAFALLMTALNFAIDVIWIGWLPTQLEDYRWAC